MSGRSFKVCLAAVITLWVQASTASPAPAGPLPPTTAPATAPTAPIEKRPFHVRLEVQPGDVKGGTYEREVPNGHYVVRVTTRDPFKLRDFGDARLEDRPLLTGTSAMNRAAATLTTLTQVTDGRVTISGAGGDVGAVLAAVELHEAHAPQRIVSWQTIGNSSKVVADRCVGADIKRRGWTGYVRRVVEPELAWGCRRFALHNPFGCLPDENMQFDQYLHAKEAGLDWLLRDFVDAWRPLTERGIEVICYLGTAVDDPVFERLFKEDPAAWERRVWACVQPALDAGMTIALDYSSSTHEGENRIATLLQERGVKIYCEPRPRADAPRWFNVPVITTNAFWKRSNPEAHPDSRWAARNDQLTGEIIQIVHLPPPGKTWDTPGWAEPDTKAILAEGHTAAAPIHILMRDRVPLWRLLKK